jgi:hypothetical protein
MYLEEIACQALINAGHFSTKEEALQSFKSDFQTHFPFRSYEEWNKDIPASLVENIITNIGKNSSISVRFLIKDLETISRLI